MHSQEGEEAPTEATMTPVQEPGNMKKKSVFMTVKLADGYIVSNQIGAYPPASNKGNECMCVFCLYNTNNIKQKTVKSQYSSELLKAYCEVYKYFESRGFKPIL